MMLDIRIWFTKWRGEKNASKEEVIIDAAALFDNYIKKASQSSDTLNDISRVLGSPLTNEVYKTPVTPFGRHLIGAFVYCKFAVVEALNAMGDLPSHPSKEQLILTNLSAVLGAIHNKPTKDTEENLATLLENANKFLNLDLGDHANKDQAKALCHSLYATFTIALTALNQVTGITRKTMSKKISKLQADLEGILQAVKTKLDLLNEPTADYASSESNSTISNTSQTPVESMFLSDTEGTIAADNVPAVDLPIAQAPDAKKAILAHLNAKYLPELTTTALSEVNTFLGPLIDTIGKVGSNIALLIEAKNAKTGIELRITRETCTLLKQAQALADHNAVNEEDTKQQQQQDTPQPNKRANFLRNLFGRSSKVLDSIAIEETPLQQLNLTIARAVNLAVSSSNQESQTEGMEGYHEACKLELSKADEEISRVAQTVSGEDEVLKKELVLASVVQLESVVSAYKAVAVALDECCKLSTSVEENMTLLKDINDSGAIAKAIIDKHDGIGVTISRFFNKHLSSIFSLSTAAKMIDSARLMESEFRNLAKEINDKVSADRKAINTKDIDVTIKDRLNTKLDVLARPEAADGLAPQYKKLKAQSILTEMLDTCAELRQRVEKAKEVKGAQVSTTTTDNKGIRPHP